MRQPIRDVPLKLSNEKDEPICSFKRQNHKTFALVRRVAPVLKTVMCVLDSVAGSSPIRLRCTAKKWRRAIRLVGRPPLPDASNRSMRPLDSLVLFFGQLRAHIQFLVGASLAADCIFGTDFIDRHLRATLPPQRKASSFTPQPWLFLALCSLQSKRSLTPAVPKPGV